MTEKNKGVSFPSHNSPTPAPPTPGRHPRSPHSPSPAPAYTPRKSAAGQKDDLAETALKKLRREGLARGTAGGEAGEDSDNDTDDENAPQSHVAEPVRRVPPPPRTFESRNTTTRAAARRAAALRQRPSV
mmetsp:Transcript_1492/g.3821  ORF Transcript_1492/g.3821 Transcript_1492/m.3821 type:complete len:130 (+) Transcript_1492:156-545(+)